MESTCRCCDTLNVATADPRLAGHHALCPKFGLHAIEARQLANSVIAPDSRDANEVQQVLDDRAVLLAALQEERTARGAREAEWQEAERRAVEEVARLRPIVEGVVALPESCKHAGYHCWDCGEGLHENAGEIWHRPGCLAMRAGAALGTLRGKPVMRDGEIVGWIERLAGTFASIASDEREGDRR